MPSCSSVKGRRPAPHGQSSCSNGFAVTRAIASSLLLVVLEACGGGSGRSSDVQAPTFTLAGSISHLEAPGLVLKNGSETLTLAAGATSFAFNTPVANLGAYSVTVVSQPIGEDCVVSNATGSVVSANVSNVAVACSTAITSPLTLGVIPVAPSPVGYRILLPVSMVGNNNVNLAAIIDTGSAGTILNALTIFPASIVSSSGFVFPAGQSAINYNGITVTNVTAARTYGPQGAIETTDYGNLGFAQLKLGAGASVTTKVVPILFVYQTSINGKSANPSAMSNLIGVNATGSVLTVPGNPVAAGTLAPFCSLATTTACRVFSPLRNLSFSGDAAEGFVINKVTLNDCTNVPVSACPVQNALVVGLNSSVATGFSMTPLDDCGIQVLPSGRSENFCSQVIRGVTVTSGGASFTGPAIFDSGEPQVRLDATPGSAFPTTLSPLASGTHVSVATPSGFSYQYTAGVGVYTTNVVPLAASSDFTNLGLEFFTQNSFLLDYSKGVEGWR